MSAQDRDQLVSQLSALLSRAAEAHHRYEVEELGGESHADWREWYAAYLLQNDSSSLLPASTTGGRVNELAELLKQADKSHQESAPETRWQDYYADYLLASLDV